jgi:hypothetical protein
MSPVKLQKTGRVKVEKRVSPGRKVNSQGQQQPPSFAHYSVELGRPSGQAKNSRSKERRRKVSEDVPLDVIKSKEPRSRAPMISSTLIHNLQPSLQHAKPLEEKSLGPIGRTFEPASKTHRKNMKSVQLMNKKYQQTTLKFIKNRSCEKGASLCSSAYDSPTKRERFDDQAKQLSQRQQNSQVSSCRKR